MRMTRIVYAFRNKVWPKPMEGLDLFIPTVKQDSSSSESSEEEEEEEEGAVSMEDGENMDGEKLLDMILPPARESRPRRAKAMAKLSYEEDSMVDVEGGGEDGEVRNFEIEKSQGLKMTLKKSTGLVKDTFHEHSSRMGTKKGTAAAAQDHNTMKVSTMWIDLIDLID